jgi:hypothetical protein
MPPSLAPRVHHNRTQQVIHPAHTRPTCAVTPVAPIVRHAVLMPHRANGFRKIQFELEPDEDGWPPVRSEGLWAVPVGPETFRVDNTPWFVCGIACGDVVRAEFRHGEWWFAEVVRRSGNGTIRIIPYPEGKLRGDRKAVLDLFAEFGVTGEGEQHFNLVALDIPPGVDLVAVQGLLNRGFAEQLWDYDVGCASEEWIAIAEPNLGIAGHG